MIFPRIDAERLSPPSWHGDVQRILNEEHPSPSQAFDAALLRAHGYVPPPGAFRKLVFDKEAGAVSATPADAQEMMQALHSWSDKPTQARATEWYRNIVDAAARDRGIFQDADNDRELPAGYEDLMVARLAMTKQQQQDWTKQRDAEIDQHSIAMRNLDRYQIPRQSAGGEDLTLWNRVVLLVQAETDKVRMALMERQPKPPLVVPEDGKEGIYPGKRYKPISDEDYKSRMDGTTKWREPDPDSFAKPMWRSDGTTDDKPLTPEQTEKWDAAARRVMEKRGLLTEKNDVSRKLSSTPEQRRSIADAYYQGVYAKRLETKNAEDDD